MPEKAEVHHLCESTQLHLVGAVYTSKSEGRWPRKDALHRRESSRTNKQATGMLLYPVCWEQLNATAG